VLSRAAFLLISSLVLAHGQTAFEVASLKLSTGSHMGWSTGGGPGQRTLKDVPLKECIKMAFDVRDDSLDGPPWLDSIRLDIVAKPPAGTPPSFFPRMLQTLLVERFRMTFHRETRIMNAYALIPAKSGINIRKVENPEAGRSRGAFGSSDGLLWGTASTMARLADALAREVNSPVQDFTGYTQLFDFRLQWVAEQAPPVTAADAQIGKVSDPGPSLLSALEEQLGLKLDKRKLPADVLVMDHVEREPIEN
jgi:uncharacterized protein (TIGR03435 family)